MKDRSIFEQTMASYYTHPILCVCYRLDEFRYLVNEFCIAFDINIYDAEKWKVEMFNGCRLTLTMVPNGITFTFIATTVKNNLRNTFSGYQFADIISESLNTVSDGDLQYLRSRLQGPAIFFQDSIMNNYLLYRPRTQLTRG